MRVKIIETGMVRLLTVINRRTGENYAADIIGNAGGFVDEFWVDDQGERCCSMETYEWWHSYLIQYQAAEDRIDALKEEHDPQEIDEAVWSIHADLEDLPSEVHKALTRWHKSEAALTCEAKGRPMNLSLNN